MLPTMQTQLLEVTDDQEINVTQDTQFILCQTNYFDERRYTLNFVFNTAGVSAEILLLYALPVGGKLNVTTITTHLVPNTACQTKVRGVLNDNSVSNFVGKIVIDKNAQQTNSFLQDYVLVVGNNTQNNSQPILTIDADDVHASHGATTGRIDEEDTYYLMSRGLNRKEAQFLIVNGFFAELLSQINDEKIKDTVLKNLGEVKL